MMPQNMGMKGPMGDQAMNDEVVSSETYSVLGALKVLSSRIDEMKAPSGKDKKSPARSCLDLYLEARQNDKVLDNGMYWIDPNSGCEADAVEVMCIFDAPGDKIQTCMYPEKPKVIKQAYSSRFTNSHQWWSDMADGMPFSYDPPMADRVARADYTSQVTFMRLLSSEARQTLTYHCKNSPADLKLRGTGDSIFSQEDAEFNIVHDNCANVGSNWGKAQIEVVTSKTAKMPIRDMATLHAGKPGQEFGFDLGPICFS
jgi:hypothetical protein